MYQLTNRSPATGAGIGCGYYDPTGTGDSGKIASLMNDYLFKICFNPSIKGKNAKHFIDYCLSNLTSGVWSGRDDEGYYATQQGLSNGLDIEKLAQFWMAHKKTIKDLNYPLTENKTFTRNYIATYAEDLPHVFDVLDQIQATQPNQN